MKQQTTLFGAIRRRGATILEYVIIAVGIAIFCTFGILMFGKVAQTQMDSATQVLAGTEDANNQALNQETTTAADASEADDAARTGTAMDRR